jgi:hypothetical protein
MSGYWFPAKRYGWGWGFPVTWQGWAVLAAFIALVAAGIFIFPPHVAMLHYVLYVAALSILFVLICWLKGEPPHWRWGNDR